MKYSREAYEKALCSLAELRETLPENERATLDFVADAIAEKGDREYGQDHNLGATLTLEQLREMDRQPVWVTPAGFWALVIAKKGQRVQLICNDGEPVWADKEIELVGPVYASPPGHILGRGFPGARMIQELRERGWTVEPPDVEKEAASDAAVQ